MCTVIAMQGEHFYFGRNMDIDVHFGEQIVALPRKVKFDFRMTEPSCMHHSILGMASVMDETALFADACNEKGLCMAGLNFSINAYYEPTPRAGKLNLAPFELIPWVLGRCATVQQAREALADLCLVDIRFRQDIPNAPLHWIIADAKESIVLESTKEGVHIYDDPVGVLTNHPPFPFHLENLCQYEGLHNRYGEVGMLGHKPFGTGFGAIGLPGDYSSPSRFVKSAWLKANSGACSDATQAREHLFHLLEAVAPPYGSVLTENGKPHYTIYSAVLDGRAGRYYYRTYFDSRIRSFSLGEIDQNGESLILPENRVPESIC